MSIWDNINLQRRSISVPGSHASVCNWGSRFHVSRLTGVMRMLGTPQRGEGYWRIRCTRTSCPSLTVPVSDTCDACDVICCSGDQRSVDDPRFVKRILLLQNWKMTKETLRAFTDHQRYSYLSSLHMRKDYKDLQSTLRIEQTEDLYMCVHMLSNNIEHAKTWPWYSTISSLPESTSTLRSASQGHEDDHVYLVAVFSY